MTCNIQVLRDFDVYGSNAEPYQFQLNRVCSDYAQPFEQFCLIPPASRLAQTSTCVPTLFNTLDPSYIFPKMTQGLITSLKQMPNMYVSYLEQDSKEVWIRDDAAFPANAILDYQSMVYNGFRPVSRPAFVLGVAASLVANNKFLLLSDSPWFPDVLQLFAIDSFGLFRVQSNAAGFPLQMRYSLTSRVFPTLACNESGSIQCVSLNGVPYLLSDTNVWQEMRRTSIVYDMCVQDDMLVLFEQQAVDFLLPVETFLALQGDFVWQCLSLDRKLLFVCTVRSAQLVFIYTIRLQSRTIVTIAQCPTSSEFLRETRYTAINVVSQASSVDILVTRGTDYPVFAFHLFANFTTATQTVPFPMRSIGAFYDNTVWFEDRKLHFSDSLVTYDTPPQMTAAMRMTATSTDVWCFVNGLLYRFSRATKEWTNQFNLYMSHDARTNDNSNTVWHAPGIEPPWYYGYVEQDVNVPSPLVFPYQFAQSRHNLFRWMFDAVENGNGTQFSHLVTHLERVNDFLLLTSFDARMHEDGNMTAHFNNDQVWESNTHDQSGNIASFVSLGALVRRPVSTQNGIYVCHVFEMQRARIAVVCFNAYNSSQFADWCQAQSPEFLTRALQQQGEFCFQNFAYVDEEDQPQFADSRCECIPSRAMFQTLFPDAFANVTAYTATRTIQNIPCLSQKCANVFLLGAENTNVLNYASEQCKQNLVVCADTLLTRGKLVMRSFTLNQDCGDGNLCNTNAECPADSMCYNGTCVQKCTTDDTCKNNLQDLTASCDKATGRCLYGIKDENNDDTSAQWVWFVVGAVAFIVILVFVILLIAHSERTK